MIILEDTRQQAKKHETKHRWFMENGIQVVRSKLVVGDYTLPTNQSICIDTKSSLLELCGNVTQQHRRFVEELELAKRLGIQLVILIEDEKVKKLEDVNNWQNPRLRLSPKAIQGKMLCKILYAMQQRHGCQFLFCKKAETGAKIMEILGGGEIGV
mgnify:CR=1 FL=1